MSVSTTFLVSIAGEVAKATVPADMVLTSGSAGTYLAEFSVDSTWTGLTLEAVFISANAAWPVNPTAFNKLVRRSVEISDNVAAVDADTLTVPGNKLWVGLTGLDENENIVKNSTMALVGTIQCGADPDGPGDGDITATRYQELKNTLSEVEADVKASIDELKEKMHNATIVTLGQETTNAIFELTAYTASGLYLLKTASGQGRIYVSTPTDGASDTSTAQLVATLHAESFGKLTYSEYESNESEFETSIIKIWEFEDFYTNTVVTCKFENDVYSTTVETPAGNLEQLGEDLTAQFEETITDRTSRATVVTLNAQALNVTDYTGGWYLFRSGPYDKVRPIAVQTPVNGTSGDMTWRAYLYNEALVNLTVTTDETTATDTWVFEDVYTGYVITVVSVDGVYSTTVEQKTVDTEELERIVNTYLESNPIGVDETLTQSGKAADAAIVGAEFKKRPVGYANIVNLESQYLDLESITSGGLYLFKSSDFSKNVIVRTPADGTDSTNLVERAELWPEVTCKISMSQELVNIPSSTTTTWVLEDGHSGTVVKLVDKNGTYTTTVTTHATSEDISQLSEEKVDKAGWSADKYLGTDSEGNVVEKDAPEGGSGTITWGDVEEGESFGVTGTEDEEPEEDTPSTETEYVTDNLAVYFDFTQYEDGYTGEVEDLSGNGVIADITGLEYTYSGRGGFIGNKLMLGNTDVVLVDGVGIDTTATLGFTTDAVVSYPFTIEVYAHLRRSYSNTLADGEVGYGNTSLPGQWDADVASTIFTADGTGIEGIECRATENQVIVWGYGNSPNSVAADVDLTIDGFNNSNIGEEYHHLVYCWESNAQKVYLDGALVLSNEGKSATLTTGNYVSMFPNTLQADVKMVRVYDDILSEYEVYTNYNQAVSAFGTSAAAVSLASDTEETTDTVTRKEIKELDKFPVTVARAVYMNNSSTTVEDEIKDIKNGGVKNGAVAISALIDSTGTVSFKNSEGVTVFTLNLSQMNVGALQLPRVYLNGDTTGMGADAPVPMTFRYIDNDTLIEAYADTEWQGNTSLVFPIKNYGFDLYSDEAMEESLDTSLLPYMETDSYHLKANYIDPSNVKNLAGARLFSYICEKIGLTFPNDGRCVVDGIPVEVYLNDKFNGVYTLNYKQSKSLFGMGDGDAEFIYRCEDGTGWGLFTGESFPTKEEFDLIWEARYPKPEKLTHHDEIQRMLKWVNDATDDEFKADYASYLNIDSVMAYKICGDIMAFVDNTAKNLTVCSWDGLVWYTVPYDMDMGMVDSEASGMVTGGNLWTKLDTNFDTEKKAMYKTLRDGGMDADTIFQLYNDILYAIGLNGYVADKKVKYEPYDNLDSRISFAEFDDYINYHKEFIKRRIELMDTAYGYTAE